MIRRDFLEKSMMAMGALLPWYGQGHSMHNDTVSEERKIKISLNAYSFNSYLQEGKMDLEELLQYCTELGFDAVDPTGYYFPGYPNIPDDSYIYRIKRMAFLNGMEISGTGIRNNFTDPDPSIRQSDLDLIRQWVEVAAKLGAPVIRVFAGRGIPQGYRRKEIDGWIVEALEECVSYAEEFGVMIGVQNHNDYLKNADQVLNIINSVDSEWLGIILDVGSFSTEDPYEDIARVAPHAVSWQIKENLGYEDRIVKTDLKKIVQILRDVDYRGYIPIETLGGDPMKKVPRFLEEVQTALYESG
ncbi:sugar phosphate isomerase/epimerase [Aliifodinibius sp. S!AR15-10]|uniref:sugar phosphate isomerase/epimerase family protein n=1 Tax=Aliifodinibius sp. S!AR15-10 TaxID=2950437 RepID=UPI002854A3CC|nr:sugar phosphate isomerase/epimerase family protein [Aliifodinibius sp. S!AR15-10]MDR8390055.1 sugar phosphate isomerase/epimerase [Aliifodinibius sp. S!AR15-10]